MSRRVLLVGGNDAFQQAVSGILNEDHIETICADDGWAALCLLNEKLPDVLIADMTFSGKSGIELCRYVRGEPEFQSLPVVLFDSHFSAANQSLALSTGANSYLSEPFAPSELVRIVLNLIPDNEREAEEDFAEPLPSSMQSPDGYTAAAPDLEQSAEPVPSDRLLSPKQIATPDLPKVTQMRAQRSWYSICWALFALALLATIELGIFDQRYTLGSSLISQLFPIQVADLGGNRASITQQLEDASQEKVRGNVQTKGKIRPDENAKARVGRKGRTAEAVQTFPPPNHSVIAKEEPYPGQKRRTDDQPQPAVAPHNNSPVANNQPSLRSPEIRDGRRSSEEMKETGHNSGSSAKNFGASGEKFVVQAGKKIGHGVKRIGTALGKLFE